LNEVRVLCNSILAAAGEIGAEAQRR
jgi:hypothetical protein